MKALVAIVALAAVGAIAAAVAVGNRLAEPTVVADPYEAGLHYDQEHHAHDAAAVGPRAPPACQPSRGACARKVGDAAVTLELSPRPVHAMTDLAFTVSVAPVAAAGAGAARIDLDMPGMIMGENRVALEPAGEGRWRGRGVLVRCPSGKRTWRATIELPRAAGRAAIATSFTFDVD